jgi:hypothetical protein
MHTPSPSTLWSCEVYFQERTVLLLRRQKPGQIVARRGESKGPHSFLIVSIYGEVETDEELFCAEETTCEEFTWPPPDEEVEKEEMLPFS